MQFILNRFNEKYHKQNSLNVKFFDEDPLTIRRIRYNQSGAVCYCMENQESGKQKISNVWKPISCSEDCSHRKSVDGIASPACKLEGTLKFLLPEISSDRIWNMKITGYTSIQRIKAYIEFQKQLGNSLIGNYTIFLKKEAQTTNQGKIFNNYVLDIVKKEETVCSPYTSNQNSTTSSTEILNSNNSPSNIKEKKEEPVNQEKEPTISEKKSNKKLSKEKVKKPETIKEPVKTEEKKASEKGKFDNHYTLLETNTKNLMKNGQPTEYVIAEFVNDENKTISAIIPPTFSEELLQCDMGTEVILELSSAGEKIFANNIEYVQKCLKNVAA